MESQYENFDSLKDCYDELIKEKNSYKAFLEYLTDKAIGDTKEILYALKSVHYWEFCGYVTVEKEIDKEQKINLRFTNEGKEYTAIWVPTDNYAIWEISDSYTPDSHCGFLLFPTLEDNNYFCIWYNE